MSFLFLSGLAHLILVWHGDILHVYAVIGLLLMSFRHFPLQRLRLWIFGLLLISTFIFSLNAVVSSYTDTESGSARLTELLQRSADVYSQGSYWEVVRFRLKNEVPVVLANVIFLIPKGLGLFLMGVYAGRAGLFENPLQHRAFFRRACAVGGAVGVASALSHIALYHFPVRASTQFIAGLLPVLKEISTYFLAVFYISAIVLALGNPVLRRLLAILSLPGRMALTNYLIQCIICSLMFYGYGLGWISNFNIVYVPALTALIYVVQLLYSRWWLNHFTHGPMEWLWRKLTYGTFVRPVNTF
jgi:uncharacterized protein